MKCLLVLVSVISAVFCVLPGGWDEVSVNDKHVERIVDFAVNDLNMKSNSLYLGKSVKITHAARQVVSGYKWNVTFDFGTTGCMKMDEGVNMDECKVTKTEECWQVIWEQQWINHIETLDFSCHLKKDKPKKRGFGSACQEIDEMFTNFQEKFSREYESSEEEGKRCWIFRENMKKVQDIQDNEQGTATYGATMYADWTADEFKKLLGVKVSDSAPVLKPAIIPEGDTPASFDWRDKNAVTPVKNQGSCGSCWAFSTTGNIEGQWSIKKKALVSLSEQELVDCDKVDQGCEGGLPSQAYKEIERLGGLETETAYSYRGVDEKCEFVKDKVKVYINSSVSISKDEKEMASWLAANGPISIGINANVMQFYFGGISHPWKIFCNPKSLDHGVLIVGYGAENGKPYWIIKNSWGPTWGEKGYYRAYRGDGVCGLNQMCTSSVVN